MYENEFKISLSQAQELESSFRRNHWTTADVNRLCNNEVLKRVKFFLDNPDMYRSSMLVQKFRKFGFSDRTLSFLTTDHKGDTLSKWREKEMFSNFLKVSEDYTTISREELRELKNAAGLLEELSPSSPIEALFKRENCRPDSPFPVSTLTNVLKLFKKITSVQLVTSLPVLKGNLPNGTCLVKVR